MSISSCLICRFSAMLTEIPDLHPGACACVCSRVCASVESLTSDSKMTWKFEGHRLPKAVTENKADMTRWQYFCRKATEWAELCGFRDRQGVYGRGYRHRQFLQWLRPKAPLHSSGKERMGLLWTVLSQWGIYIKNKHRALLYVKEKLERECKPKQDNNAVRETLEDTSKTLTGKKVPQQHRKSISDQWKDWQIGLHLN